MKEIRTSTLALLGAKWVSIGLALQKAAQFVVMLVLIRLLMPQDFGLMSFALVVSNILGRIKHLGMNSALMQRQDQVPQAANAFFLASFSLSLLLGGVLVLSAGEAATFFKNGDARLVLQVMALQLPIDAACAVQRALAMKALEFRKVSMIAFFGSLANGFVSVVLALMGAGVWALVLGYLAESITQCVFWWTVAPWRPSLDTRANVTRQTLGFGLLALLASVLEGGIDTISRIAMGRLLGAPLLGQYDISSRLVSVPVRNIGIAGQRVSLPAFCREQHDLRRVGGWFFRIVAYTFYVVVPGAVCVMLIPDLVVSVLCGPKWLPAIPLVRILGAAAVALPLASAGQVYLAAGRVNLLVVVTALRFLVAVPLLVAAAHVSLVAVCGVEAAVVLVMAPVSLWLVLRVTGATLGEAVSLLWPPLAAGIPLAAALIAMKIAVVGFVVGPEIVRLAAIVVPALLVYAVVAFALRPRVFHEFREAISRSVSG
jgi:O-antigen/teichoic acid export membrane protein